MTKSCIWNFEFVSHQQLPLSDNPYDGFITWINLLWSNSIMYGLMNTFRCSFDLHWMYACFTSRCHTSNSRIVARASRTFTDDCLSLYGWCTMESFSLSLCPSITNIALKFSVSSFCLNVRTNLQSKIFGNVIRNVPGSISQNISCLFSSSNNDSLGSPVGVLSVHKTMLFKTSSK